MRGKVVITDYLHQAMADGLQEMGFDVDVKPEISQQELLDCVPIYIGMVVATRIKVNKELLNRAANMKFIARAGSGMENIDVACAKTKGIISMNSPEGNCNAVGEHALGMLLALNNNLLHADSEVRRGHWHRETNRGVELSGKTVGLIGYGHTGKAFAKKLSGFESRVLAFDKYLSNFSDEHVEEVTMGQLCEQVDVLSLHVPLTDETKYLINNQFINRLKRKPILVNTSRGKIVETSSILSALQNGSLSGFCADVLENENPSKWNEMENQLFNQLFKFEQVIFSPHVAGWTHQSKLRIATVLLQKIRLAMPTVN